jgi:hypothetical protein
VNLAKLRLIEARKVDAADLAAERAGQGPHGDRCGRVARRGGARVRFDVDRHGNLFGSASWPDAALPLTTIYTIDTRPPRISSMSRHHASVTRSTLGKKTTKGNE